MNKQIENSYTVPEMAEQLGLTVDSFRNHRLGEVKTACDNFKLGKKVYVNKAHFERYVERQIAKTFSKANQAA